MGWLTGYAARLRIPIAASSDGTLTNHRELINIHSGTGTNSAGEVYLQGAALNWPNDIRFTRADGETICPHFRVSYDANVQRVVVLMDSIPATVGANFYLYFGKTSDIDASSPAFPCLMANNFGSYLYTGEAIATGRWGTIAQKNDGTYVMYYATGSDATSDIKRATSPDLLWWTVYGANIINDLLGPDLLRELDGVTPILYDSKYWMLTCKSDGSAIQIRSASAIDGDTWALKTDNAIVPTGSGWYKSKVFTASFTKEGETYYIFFSGYNATTGKWSIGYATASAPAGPWTVQDMLMEPGEAFEGTSVGDPVVRKWTGDNNYYLFYSGGVGASSYNSYATASTLTGTYIKSSVLMQPQGQSYPEIIKSGSAYVVITDNRNDAGKDVFIGDSLSSFFKVRPMATSGNVAVSGGEMSIAVAGAYLQSVQTFQYKRFVARVKFPATLISYHYFGFNASPLAGTPNQASIFSYYTPDIKLITGDAAGAEVTSIYDAGYRGSYHEYDIRWISGQVKVYVDGVLKATHAAEVSSVAAPVGFYEYLGTGYLYCDWFVVLDSPGDVPAWGIPAEERGGAGPQIIGLRRR